MKKAAIVCANGLGDGLLMMIVAHQLKQIGYHLTIFHNRVNELSSLFQDVVFEPHPSFNHVQAILKPFDLVIIENDHSERAYLLSKLRRACKLNNLIFFFPTPSPLFLKGDFLFDAHFPFATNLHKGCKQTLHIPNATKSNGILFPSGKIYRRYTKRIVIHPTSNDPKRNWSVSRFLFLARLLQNEGYTISFSVSPSEQSHWLHVKQKGFALCTFETLSEVGAYLYESGFFIGNDSGIGHLASNLGISTLTISGNSKRVRLWRPDWANGEIVTPSFPLPNLRGLGLCIRENFWQHFISAPRTLKAFHKLTK